MLARLIREAASGKTSKSPVFNPEPMPRTPFVAGNWKMNTNRSSATELARAVGQGAPREGVRVGIAPPFVYLDAAGHALAGSSVMLGAQDVCFEKNGAF